MGPAATAQLSEGILVLMSLPALFHPFSTVRIMEVSFNQIVAATEPEWEPALGEYGWLWVLLVVSAAYTTFKLVQRKREQVERRRRFEALWGQREGESVDDWQARLKKRDEDREKWKRERERKARQRLSDGQWRSSRGSAYNERGEFDPPGGWGAAGPG